MAYYEDENRAAWLYSMGLIESYHYMVDYWTFPNDHSIELWLYKIQLHNQTLGL